MLNSKVGFNAPMSGKFFILPLMFCVLMAGSCQAPANEAQQTDQGKTRVYDAYNGDSTVIIGSLERALKNNNEKIAILEARLMEKDEIIADLNASLSQINLRVEELNWDPMSRIVHLESYFDRSEPEKAAALWGWSKDNRNGAVEYLTYSIELQEKLLAELGGDGNWHTGVSNPHIGGYAVGEKHTLQDGTVMIPVTLHWAYEADNWDSDQVCMLTIERTDQTWYVAAVEYGEY